MTNARIKNLDERLEKLFEVKRNLRQTAFAGCWFTLSDIELQLVRIYRSDGVQRPKLAATKSHLQ